MTEYLNNADAVFDLDIPVEGAEARVADAVRGVTGWEGEATVSTISGGITNLLFKVDLRQGDTVRTALARIYGSNTEMMIDRAVENMVFAELSRQGFAPTYHGRFKTGRVEGYLDARPLQPEEMGREPFAPLIASEVARMHALTVPLPHDPMLFPKLHLWLRMACSLKFEGQKLKDFEALRLTATFASELQWYEGAVGAGGWVHPYLLESAFCHNDLLSGNVLVLNGEEKAKSLTRVQLIDYEYGGYNLRGFDFANHFCEQCGFDFDVVKNYPSRDTRRKFLSDYLTASASHGKPAGDLCLDELVDGVDRLTLASDLWWGFWAVLQAQYSPIDFDFMGYARLRLASFLYHKALYCSDSCTPSDGSNPDYDTCVKSLTPA